MKNIHKFNVFASTDLDLFYKNLTRLIEEYQNDGLEVEVQYSATYTGGAMLCHSVLILARK